MKIFAINTCLICNKKSKRLGQHVKLSHNIEAKDYYDKYLKKENEGICPMCGKNTPFLGITIGYQKHCCARCGIDNPETREHFEQTMIDRHDVRYSSQKEEFRDKSKQTKLIKYGDPNYNNREKAVNTNLIKYGTESPIQSKEVQVKMQQINLERYGCKNPWQSKLVIEKSKQTKLERYNDENYNNSKKRKETCLDKYGVEYALQAEEVRNKIEETNIEKYGVTCTLQSEQVRNKIISQNQEKFGVDWYVETEEFKEKYKQTILSKEDSIDTKWRSKFEDVLIREIKSISNTKITHNNKKIIYPKELDIYLPELNLAIEYNGLLYHSNAFKCPKDYHLMKSLLCRDNGIRLIHIYEFEDLDEQIELLKFLILGEDKYPKEDFNKNNLIDTIPEPEIVYQDNRLVIYGAGKLY